MIVKTGLFTYKGTIFRNKPHSATLLRFSHLEHIMRWTVEGADKDTGEDRVIAIEADTKAQAERIAVQRGLLVSRAYRPDEAVVEKLKTMAGIEEATTIPDAEPIQLDYRSPTRVPEYPGIIKGAQLLVKFAASSHAAGIVLVLLAIVSPVATYFIVLNSGGPNAKGAASLAVLLSLPVAIGLIFGAIYCFRRATLLRLQAELALATRDIARNSFR